MAQVHKSTSVAPKPTPVAQVDFNSCNLKPAPVAKLLVFSNFSFALAFRKVLFVLLFILSPPRVAKSRLL
jgi:hypothetical protein